MADHEAPERPSRNSTTLPCGPTSLRTTPSVNPPTPALPRPVTRGCRLARRFPALCRRAPFCRAVGGRPRMQGHTWAGSRVTGGRARAPSRSLRRCSGSTPPRTAIGASPRGSTPWPRRPTSARQRPLRATRTRHLVARKWPAGLPTSRPSDPAPLEQVFSGGRDRRRSGDLALFRQTEAYFVSTC